MAQIRIRMPMFPDRQSQSFLVGDSYQLLMKLGHELSHFLDEKQQGFYTKGHLALNISMSAWHMTDWVYYDLNKNLSTIAHISKQPIGNKKEYIRWVLNSCEGMRICRVIATAGKHGKVDTFPDSTIQTQFRLDESPEDPNRVNPTWLIDYQSKQYEAADVFKQVHRFWEDVLSKLGMMEDPTIQRLHRGW